MLANKMNCRKRKEYIKMMNIIIDVINQNNTWNKKRNRRKLVSGTKDKVVIEYKKNNPNATMYRCQKDAGLSKNTIKKYWK